MRLPIFVFLALFSLSLQAAGKTGFINSKELLQNSPQAIAAQEALKSQFGEREQNLRKMAEPPPTPA